ncbi:MAG: pyruvate kinase [Spirochaetales bacterium]|nr:pyruvate kinase [Spirochaetales bacterium]
MKRDTRFSKTKIIGTIGPSVNDPAVIADLIRAGMDVARLNFSHGSHEEHQAHIEALKEGARIAESPLAVMADLCGPKIRLGLIEREFVIAPGETVAVSASPSQFTDTCKLLPTEYSKLPTDVKPGDRILIDDGLLQLSVREIQGPHVYCEVIDGGTVKSRKGMNLPHVAVSARALTEKDIDDLEFIITRDIDYIALSFVRDAEDIRQLKDILTRRQKNIPVIAKIEKPEAIENIDAIIEATDMVMVARGDLGVEMMCEEVPVLQKMIIAKCIEHNKPVITATQMLDSMINNPRPTRAEASDVANAVFDGTDAVMLSGETSVGKYPVNAVRTMDRIIRSAEKVSRPGAAALRRDSTGISDARNICRSACIIAEHAEAKAIIAITQSGRTARMLSMYRPDIPILAFSQHVQTLRNLNIVWGVQGELIEEVSDTDSTLRRTRERALALGYLRPGDKVVYVTGIPLLESKEANMVKLDTV